MKQLLTRLTVETDGEGFTDLTPALNQQIRSSGLQQGVLQVVALHTSCSQEVDFA